MTTRKVIKLYQCTDEEGTLRIREVKGGPLEQSDLLSKDSFIIDNGAFGIWVWVGKRASSTERTEAMRNAQGFIKKKGKWKKKLKRVSSAVEYRLNELKLHFLRQTPKKPSDYDTLVIVR